jgi:hypothetical protein
MAAAGTATVLGAGNGIVITHKKAHKLVLMCKSAAGGSTMTILAGNYPPALSQGQGSKVTAAFGAGLVQVIVVEAARHLTNAAGVNNITVEFGATGDAFWAFEVPA